MVLWCGYCLLSFKSFVLPKKLPKYLTSNPVTLIWDQSGTCLARNGIEKCRDETCGKKDIIILFVWYCILFNFELQGTINWAAGANDFHCGCLWSTTAHITRT